MSAIENRFKEYKYDEYFPFIFTDKNGEEFKAKPDCIMLDTRDNTHVYLELKQCRLNNKTSIQTSWNALYGQCRWRGLSVLPDASHNELSACLWTNGYYSDCLEHAWNHSLRKHAIVAKELLKHDIRYMIAFSSHDPYMGKGRRRKPFKLHYQSKGIHEVMLESELWKLINSGVLVPVLIH